MNLLILGANGFLGRNLLKYFSQKKNVKVTAFDLFFDTEKEKNVIYIQDDIFNISKYKLLLMKQEVIIDLIGKSGAIDSFKNYHKDVTLNNIGLLTVLDTIKSLKEKPLIIFPSTRLVYGIENPNPVKEDSIINPNTIYGVNKLACELYLKSYYNLYGIEYIILRISIPYGSISHARKEYGIINYFISRACKDEDITIYGNGSQKRDIVYIKDLSQVFNLVIKNRNVLKNNIYNLGGLEILSLYEIAKKIISCIGRGRISMVPWPPEAERVETGDLFLDSTKLYSQINFFPKYNLESAIPEIIDIFGRDQKWNIS